jgi:hypothetical protein
MTTATRRVGLLALAVLLIGLLLVLGPNLERVELQPAQPNSAAPAGVETVTPSLGTAPTGAVGYAVLLRILFAAAVVCLGVIVVGAFFRREFRAYLLLFAVLTALILAFYFLWERAPHVEPEPPEQESVGFFELLDRPPAAPVEEETDTSPSNWSFVAIAAAISAVVVLVLAVLWSRFGSRWRRASEEDKTQLDELVETVGAAADEIQLGGDPRSAVLRCYREMIRIFARRRTIEHTVMTARELAVALRRAGFDTEHVDRLTEIFELVRYGNRGGDQLAGRAAECLDAIRRDAGQR